MVTATTTETYVGVEGSMKYGGVDFCYVSFDVEITREVIEIERGSKYSNLSLPGTTKISVKLKYGLVDGQLFCDAFDDGTNTVTTSDETLHAAITGTSAIQTISTALTNPSSPMTLKCGIVTTDGYSAGSITVIGTDLNGDEVSENIPFGAETSATTNYIYGGQQFASISIIIIPAVFGTGESITVYGAGQKTVTLGKPKLVSISGKVAKADGSSYTEISLTDCWISKMPLSLGGPGTAVIPECEIVVSDPDENVQIITESSA